MLCFSQSCCFFHETLISAFLFLRDLIEDNDAYDASRNQSELEAQNTHPHSDSELWLRTALSRKFLRPPLQLCYLPVCTAAPASVAPHPFHTPFLWGCTVGAPSFWLCRFGCFKGCWKLKKVSLPLSQSTMAHWPGPEVDFCHHLSEVRKIDCTALRWGKFISTSQDLNGGHN